MKIDPPLILMMLTLLLCAAAVGPNVQAIVPAPDGGYPGGNTAEGQAALLSLTTGGFNTAIGWLSLRAVTTGNYNTGVGAGTLALNTGDENTATGTGALLFNTTGFQNTANGAFALFFNTIGHQNTATGDQALFSNTTGGDNTANGDGALHNNTTGVENTANGVSALSSNTTGGGNTANGGIALSANTTGSFNTVIGDNALSLNTTGNQNIAVGVNAGNNVTTAANVICIGANVSGNNVNNSCYIGNIFNATSSGGTPVFINSDSKLGTATSSRRFKEEVKPMERTSEALFALEPVTFRYKKGIDPQGIPQFGLVAEDVEAVNPDLVVRDKEGKPYSVRYDQVNAMLLNEFLKEHKKVEEQQATITQLKKDFGATTAQLTARLNEQAAQIQKVSAQFELNKSAPQTVLNNQ